MDDNNASYIQGTSEYISEAKPSFIRIGDKLKDAVKVIASMDSAKQTKAETKEELTEDILEVTQELRKLVSKTNNLGIHISSLAQKSDGKNK
jgi:hypothetical protein